MTTSTESSAEVTAVETVTGVIDGRSITVPKGTLIIRAAELLGIEIPRFCDHPLLDPVAACRQCLVDVSAFDPRAGEVRPMPKPQPSCAIELADGMEIRTQHTSEVAAGAQAGVMEFLLTNHPLDCPVCDKAGECPLQNQAMQVGRADTRYTLPKLTFDKPVSISAQILLDQERCVNCARCTRFADQIAGDPLIDLLDRGARQHPGVGEEPFDSYFSGNTIQICPVGALTSAEYRFRSRPFDLVSVPTTCEHCASGCSLRTDIRTGTVMRRYAWEDPDVNEQWNCDKGRFAFNYLTEGRITVPLVREDGQLREASWPEALDVAAAGLAGASGSAAVLTGGRLTVEDAYAYSRFARVALNSDSIDFRARAASDEELDFLAGHVAGTTGPTYAELEAAPTVLLVGFEPEDESPIVFLRLRKAARNGTRVFAVAPFASKGLHKLSGRLIAAVPGTEASVLDDLPEDVISSLNEDGSVVLVGERLAGSRGALAAAADLADRTGSGLGWVPRRAGERGALDAGCLPGLLPGGRPITDPVAREQVAAIWGIAADELPQQAGDTTAGVIARAELDRIDAEDPRITDPPRLGSLVVAGVDPADTVDPEGLRAALGQAPFVVSLETRVTDATAQADVVLPVAVVTEKGGTFLNWEGRPRPFGPAVSKAGTFTDAEVLAMLAERMDLDAAPRTVAELRSELEALGTWQGDRPAPAAETIAPDAGLEPGSEPDTVVLASWRQLLDLGALQVGDPHLAATSRESVARVSAATAAATGVGEGDPLTVSTASGSITVPVAITNMPDDIVWVPFNSPDSQVTESLGASPGDRVHLAGPLGGETVEDGEINA